VACLGEKRNECLALVGMRGRKNKTGNVGKTKHGVAFLQPLLQGKSNEYYTT